MHDVCVYLSSLPRIADRERKVVALRSFAEGCRKLGLSVLEQTTYNVVPARLAVILGWVGTKIKGPHIQLRKDVIAHQHRTGNHIMPIDGSCFKFADTASVFLRYSLGGVYYNTCNYANQNSDSSKWNLISKTLGLELAPWRTQGNHILLCLQRDAGWSMKGVNMAEWALKTVTAIRQHSARPILIRPHPKNPIDTNLFRTFKNIQFSTSQLLSQDAQGAWASVFFNSSACVASVLAGVPVFIDDDDCVARAVANRSLAMIEDPVLHDRNQWLNDLSACHWTDNESRQGLIYQQFKQYL